MSLLSFQKAGVAVSLILVSHPVPQQTHGREAASVQEERVGVTERAVLERPVSRKKKRCMPPASQEKGEEGGPKTREERNERAPMHGRKAQQTVGRDSRNGGSTLFLRTKVSSAAEQVLGKGLSSCHKPKPSLSPSPFPLSIHSCPWPPLPVPFSV